ncbi:lipocalin-like domain-containing protein [Mongoliitalea daihaiensis]|uniref:lipocalin family protein n=1 Tax=Mongoliitalea daihaiensis TaxID=2782006 RepID=UPI001F20CFBA|nr:lipocalin family protein [Mongoliitalea daihaiensis]UJP65027.1 lipocalin family protein [Mongoliitalea daihaiensis]
MRVVALLLLVSCFACSQDDKEPEFSILGYWNLSVMQNAVEGIEMNEPLFQERYIFNDDGTFIKFSTRLGGDVRNINLPVQSFGKYSFVESAEASFENLFQVELLYETNPQIAGSCLPEFEFLVFDNARKLKNVAWASCDGPVLIYTRK